MNQVEQTTTSSLQWHVTTVKDITSKYVNMAKIHHKFHPNLFCLELDRAMISRQYRNIGKMVKKDVDTFVQRLASKLGEIDKRFDVATVLETGSYSEGVKIGEPDEFDYLFELKAGEAMEQLKFIPAHHPGFVHVGLKDGGTLEKWLSCVVDAGQCDKCGRIAPEALSTHDYSDCTNNYVKQPFLAPELIQEEFRKLLDAAVPTIDLPPNLSHSGCEKPNYSGYRKHGPATLVQFRYTNDEVVLLLTVDITLAIKVPTPIELTIFGVDFHLKQNCNNTDLREQIMSWIEHEPGIHVIPLYSNLLTALGKYHDKFAWRVSCSSVEKRILTTLSDNSLPKVCLRVLKALRDAYLTEGYKKRTVKRRRPKPRSASNHASSASRLSFPESHTTSTNQTESNETNRNGRVSNVEEIHKKNFRGRRQKKKLPQISEETLSSYLSKEEYVNMATYLSSGNFVTISAEEDDDETADSSENEFLAALRPQQLRQNFQRTDIRLVDSGEIRPGEHYGLCQLLASMELKTYCLHLIDKVEDLNDLSSLAKHVFEAIKQFYIISAKESSVIKGFFFDGAILSPRSAVKRNKLLNKMQHLLATLNVITGQTHSTTESDDIFRISINKLNI